MTAFEDFVNGEIPKRSVLLTTTSTGYDGDPNSLAAPDIIKNSPLGTYYREPTAGIWWRKSETVWEEQGGGPGGGGLATQESMIWTLDGVLGVSPPEGTIITSQAEFDALGAPLKYAQDVERIRPTFVNHHIRVNVAAGTVPENPDVGPYGSPYGTLLQGAGRWHCDKVPWLPVLGGDFYTMYPGISFKGTQTEIDASVAGTFSRDARTRRHTFARTAGTWTAGALVGATCEILSGPLAGTIQPIVSNDTTSFLTAGDADPGAATVRIYTRASTLLGGLYYGFNMSYNQGPSDATLMFLDIDFDPSPTMFHACNGISLLLSGCKMTGFGRLDSGFIQLTGTEFVVDSSPGSGGFDSFGPGSVQLVNSWFHGGSTELVYLRDRISLTMSQNTLDGSGMTGGFVLYANGTTMEALSGLTHIIGNASCYGILLAGIGEPSAGGERGYLVVDNCAVAVLGYNMPVWDCSFLTNCSGNQYLFNPDVHYRQRINVPYPEAITSAIAYTVALFPFTGAPTRAELVSAGFVGGEVLEFNGYDICF